MGVTAIMCDRCGARIGKGSHYMLRVATYAAKEEIRMNLLDLSRDFRAEIERELERVRARSARELEEEVFHAKEYDLCRACREAFRKDPFGKDRTDHIKRTKSRKRRR